MKRIFFSLLLCLVSVVSFAQEPGNNLLLTVSELKAKFPDLVSWGQMGDRPCYKSPEAEVLFETIHGKVVSEYTSYDGPDGFLQDVYKSLLDGFGKKAQNHLWGNDRNSITFIYSYFTIYISYKPNDSVSLMYDLLPKYLPK